MAMLEVQDMHVSYGVIKAVRGISLTVDQGDIVTIIGANGAGKSTTLNTLAGVLKPDSGRVIFNDEDLAGASSVTTVRRGITLAPEGRQVFPRMSVEQNLLLGAFKAPKEKKQRGLEVAYSLFKILKERQKQLAGTLSGGEQQMLAVARALMSEPKLLMLDEPSLGLAPLIVREIFSLIRRINKDLGTTILLVEQNAKMALGVSNRGYVMETGRITLTDTGENLLQNDRVKAAYLGVS